MIENIILFLNTHLALLTLLMPWKSIPITYIVTNDSETWLYSLWNMFYMPNWPLNANQVEDESLSTGVNWFIGLLCVMLLLSLTALAMNTVLVDHKHPYVFTIVNLLNFLVSVGLGVFVLVSQKSFDDSFAHIMETYKHLLVIGEYDTRKMFFSITPIFFFSLCVLYLVVNDMKKYYAR